MLPPRSADVCLAVRVCRRITLRKHRTSALNRTLGSWQLMFSLSGAAAANRTPPARATGPAAGPCVYRRSAPLCRRACACSCYNGPKLCVTPSRFLPFKVVFSGERRRQSSPNFRRRLPPQGGGQIVKRQRAGAEHAHYECLRRKYRVNGVMGVWKARGIDVGGGAPWSHQPGGERVGEFTVRFGTGSSKRRRWSSSP